jgi:DNA topoisomerase III
MTTLIITEKSSQAKDLRAALGDRYGKILPAEGHLLRLAEPDEVNAGWKFWSCALLKPDGLYPTKPASQGNKPSKLKAIADALKTCDQVILATDCDREGQLIGQEILEHFNYRGPVQRALFTAQDPKTLQQAFAALKPNHELRPLYEAAVARQQSDQIFNLSLTRTATKTLLAQGTRGVIGIGRVKTPTLGIICLRELEIRNFRPEDYFEIVAAANAAGGVFQMRCAPPPKHRIKDRARAEAIHKAANGHRGSLAVSVEDCKQAPPKLHDLPSLQKTCGQRWGWTADKTLSIAQELYDGEGKKIITYPRAEARYLTENQIADVPAITSALTRLRGFAHLDLSKPVIRRGKSGTFCDKALEGVSHHAIIPNVNVLDDLEQRIARLSDDEKRLFALVCRAYLAAVMPDFEYRQTIIILEVPVPGAAGAEFRASGRIPLIQGWKAVYGASDPDAVSETEQTLPPLTDGEPATLTDPRIEAKKTQPPPRYNEGTLIDAMQNAWRFVTEPATRERLKEAKGIGTPATRAEIIKGLKRQNLLTTDGKLVVPTEAGLQLFELLRGAAPALVDPGTTAVWEMQLDAVVTGKANYRTVIDGVAAEAQKLIGILQQRSGGVVRLDATAPATPRGKERPAAKTAKGKKAPKDEEASEDRQAAREPAKKRAPAKRKRVAKSEAEKAEVKKAAPRTARKPAAKPAAADEAPPPSAPSSAPPTARMVAYAQKLSKTKNLTLPAGYDQNFQVCREFLNQHA